MRVRGEPEGGRARAIGAFVLAAAFLSLAGQALAGDSSLQAVAGDDSRLWFETDERLSPADTDGGSVDVYETDDGSPDLISASPADPAPSVGAFFSGASDDGTKVFFVTAEQLDPVNDTDQVTDVYMVENGARTLISRGQINGNGAFPVTFEGNTLDGDTVYFRTQENLVSADTDGTTASSADVYSRNGSTTTFVSTGAQGNSTAQPANFEAASEDGAEVFFTTQAKLEATDLDSLARDVYSRVGSTTSLVSTGPDDPHNDVNATFGGIADDGSQVFFETADPMVTDSFEATLEDEDSSTDVYRVSPNGANAFLFSRTPQARTDPEQNAFYQANDVSGSILTYRTRESKRATVSEDPDGGDTDLIQFNPFVGDQTEDYVSDFNDGVDVTFQWASGDASRIIYTTRHAETVADSDNCFGTSGDCLDVYLGSSASPTFSQALASTTSLSGGQNGNTAHEASFGGASDDGDKILFETAARLQSTDTDTATDVYRRAAGAFSTAQISRGAINGNDDGFDADFAGTSADGSNSLFETDEQLTAQDIDADQDLYFRFAGTFTILFSREAVPPETTIADGASLTNDPTPTFSFSSDEDPNATFTCSVDQAAFAACNGGMTHTTDVLAEGSHTFQVRARDAATNVDPTPAELEFEVDLTAPDTTVSGRRKRTTKPGKKRARVRFRLASTEPGSSFACKLDRKPFRPCGPGFVRRVKVGRHKLKVRASDGAGNVDPTPAVKRFMVIQG